MPLYYIIIRMIIIALTATERFHNIFYYITMCICRVEQWPNIIQV